MRCTMLKGLEFESKITIKHIPLQWISRIELFYPDLPGYPIMYIHKILKDKTRVYGFPVTMNIYNLCDKKMECDIEFLFLSNVDLQNNNKIQREVINELEHRIGLIDKIGLNDVLAACKGQKVYEDFFRELWKYIEALYGSYLPYGKLYEELFSIVRFVSAFDPKTGRQSELRMVYNFMSIFGENITLPKKWNHYEFFLIPTYDDLINRNLTLFPKFEDLFEAIELLWRKYYTKKSNILGVTINSMPKGLGDNKSKFIDNMENLLAQNIITLKQKDILERLVDVFNRLPTRAAFFISSIMIPFQHDYRLWNKTFFIEFYNRRKGRGKFGAGISEKVIACFLQQGFLKQEVIPIDTWVRTFYQSALGIDDKLKFFSSFDSLGKIERVIWLASQANKTNINKFFDLLWCQRFGTNGNKQLRGANPIACYECNLRRKCPSYSLIADSNVAINETNSANDEIKGHVIRFADKNDCKFICLTVNRVPKKIYMKKQSDWVLVDEFSGYILDNCKIPKSYILCKTNELVLSIPSFIPKFSIP